MSRRRYGSRFGRNPFSERATTRRLSTRSLTSYIQKELKPQISKDTKTRLEGVKQIVTSVATINPIISSAYMTKDIAIGSHKIVDPKGFKKNKLARKLDNI